MKRALSRSVLLSLVVLVGCAERVTDGQERFASPEAAASALVAASRSDDNSAALRILGPDGAKLIYSGDPVADDTMRDRFVEAYEAYHRLDADSSQSETLIVGTDAWPLPLPIVKDGGGWMFDTRAGTEAILNRRIGANELFTIGVCRELVYAEWDYADARRAVHGYRSYTSRINSRPGQQDGLYWPARGDDGDRSPLGPLIAEAESEGYDGLQAGHEPFHGYYFKPLLKQGSHATSGAHDYTIDGRMTRGFAWLAFPAVYGDSGVKSFIVNQTGIVYEKDLGPDTAIRAGQMDSYDPDIGWNAAP